MLGSGPEQRSFQPWVAEERYLDHRGGPNNPTDELRCGARILVLGRHWCPFTRPAGPLVAPKMGCRRRNRRPQPQRRQGGGVSRSIVRDHPAASAAVSNMAQRSQQDTTSERPSIRPGKLLGPGASGEAQGPSGSPPTSPPWLLALRSGESDQAPALESADLRGLDLSGLNLTGARLAGADLTGANLEKTRLFGADLAGAQLHGVHAKGADFTGANLSGALLSEGLFDHAGFGSANLSGVVAHRASFRGAALSACSAREASFAASDLTEARCIDANFEGADFQTATLGEADLTGVRVAGATFRRARLKGAKLLGVMGYASADWIFVELDDMNLTGGVLLREFAHDQNFLFEFRNQSRRHEWVYRVWWLTSDCGRSVLRWGVCSFGLAAFFACVYTFVGIDYGPNATWLSPFYFSVVTLTTLGYGEVVPVTAAAQATVITEVILGYVMLGGMLSLISNKLSRRGG